MVWVDVQESKSKSMPDWFKKLLTNYQNII